MKGKMHLAAIIFFDIHSIYIRAPVGFLTCECVLGECMPTTFHQRVCVCIVYYVVVHFGIVTSIDWQCAVGA